MKTETISITELRKNFYGIIKTLDKKSYVITIRKKPVAMLMKYQENQE